MHCIPAKINSPLKSIKLTASGLLLLSAEDYQGLRGRQRHRGGAKGKCQFLWFSSTKDLQVYWEHLTLTISGLLGVYVVILFSYHLTSRHTYRKTTCHHFLGPLQCKTDLRCNHRNWIKWLMTLISHQSRRHTHYYFFCPTIQWNAIDIATHHM